MTSDTRKVGLFEEQPRDLLVWDNEHQEVHSLLWSCFLDLDKYPAQRTQKRYLAYGVAHAIDKVLEQCESKETKLPRLREPFLSLALWTTAPRFFGRSFETADQPERTDSTELSYRKQEQREIDDLGERFRKAYDEYIGIPLAASRLELEPGTRPLLPPLHCPTIEDARIRVVASRRAARASVTASLQIPYFQMLEVLEAESWTACGYLGIEEHKAGSIGSTDRPTDGAIKLQIRLPGGNEAEKNERGPYSKVRLLDLTYSAAWTPFFGRVDYAAKEIEPKPGRARVLRAKDPRRSDSVTWTEIESLQGYFAVEKARGRPGWTNFTAERTVRFESRNHDRLRVETLQYWSAVELIALAQYCFDPATAGVPCPKPSGSVQAVGHA